MKLKVFHTAKETIGRVKRKPREWVGIVVSYTSEKRINIQNI